MLWRTVASSSQWVAISTGASRNIAASVDSLSTMILRIASLALFLALIALLLARLVERLVDRAHRDVLGIPARARNDPGRQQ